MILHASKINGISVFQVGSTSLVSNNKKDQRADVHKGKNEGVDLGKGVQNIQITVKVNNDGDFRAVYSVLSNDRKGTITDRFLGSVKVSFTNYSILHTDKEIGVTTIKISMVVDEEFTPNINYDGQMDSAKSALRNSGSGGYV